MGTVTIADGNNGVTDLSLRGCSTWDVTMQTGWGRDIMFMQRRTFYPAKGAG